MTRCLCQALRISAKVSADKSSRRSMPAISAPSAGDNGFTTSGITQPPFHFSSNSFCLGPNQPRADEALQAARVRMQAGPVVERQVDDDQPRGGQPLRDPFARFHIPRCDQLDGEVVEAGVMADQHNGCCAFGLGQQIHQPLRVSVIDAFLADSFRCFGKAVRQERPALLGTGCRRYQRKVRFQTVMRHVGANKGGVVAPSLGELAVAVSLTRLDPFGLGVAQQHKTAHSGKCRFLRPISLACRGGVGRAMSDSETAAYGQSWYAATMVEAPPRPLLASDLDVDVCVIGGGLAGLTVAREIARSGWSVVLLEAGRLAGSASGRNTGFVLPGFAAAPETLVARVGFERAKDLWSLSQAGLDYVRSTIQGVPGIDAEDGWLHVSKVDNRDELLRDAELLRSLGCEVEDWPTERVRAVLRSERYFGAVRYARAFTIHPLNYALALAAAAERDGARVFENTPAL